MTGNGEIGIFRLVGQLFPQAQCEIGNYILLLIHVILVINVDFDYNYCFIVEYIII